jgi:hypothetical protein
VDMSNTRRADGRYLGVRAAALSVIGVSPSAVPVRLSAPGMSHFTRY